MGEGRLLVRVCPPWMQGMANHCPLHVPTVEVFDGPLSR